MKYLLALGFAFICMSSFGQDNFNLELLANVSLGEDGNDIWGYVDSTGVEYAAVGSRTKVSIYSLEDPSNPILRSVVPGAASTWRDMKHYKDHIYFTTDEGSDGLGIIDMSMAPDSITYSYWRPELTINNFTDQLRKCHNLYIDEDGYCYLAGCNVPDQYNTNGIIILDLNQDPKDPVVLGNVTRAYSHDVYVRDTLMYCSEIYNGEFAIYSISDKNNPVLLATQGTSSDFTHNAWLSDDGNYLFTTDEVGNAFVDAYDISDFDNIFQTDVFQPRETVGNGVIPHNTHVFNNYLVTSWYTDGLVITDAHDPSNLVKVGSYDTFFGEENINGQKFSGCWGAYPYLPSGIILASDIESGLFVFQPDYQRAAYIEGTITDIDSGSGINNATIRLLDSATSLSQSNANGAYKGGEAQEGSFEFVFSHPFYFNDTLTATLVKGEVTILDAALESRATILQGNVVDEAGNAVPQASIRALTNGETFSETANSNGQFEIPVLEGTSILFGGAWGYKTNFIQFTPGDDINVTIVVEKGYRDEFFLDLGWSSTGDAESGAWEREEPNGTTYQGTPSNPGSDNPSDIGMECYTTGNGGGAAGDDDVDDGVAILTSPIMDLTGYQNPYITFDYWFFNDGGFSATNDELTVYIFSDNTPAVLLNVEDSTNGWVQSDTLYILDFVPASANVFVEVITADQADTGHLVEAGFDLFEVQDGIISNTSDQDITINRVNVSPNPAGIQFDVTASQTINTLKVIDLQGKVVFNQNINSKNASISCADWISGTYIVLGSTAEGKQFVNKITIE